MLVAFAAQPDSHIGGNVLYRAYAAMN